jgi:ferric enterobactin receptor
MNKFYPFFLFLSLLTSLTQAQTGTVNGSVIDKLSNAPLEYASVSLYRSSDSALVNGMVTKKDGRITFKIKEGKYYLQANFIGYKPTYISGIQVTSNQVNDVGVIIVAPDQKVLQDITISAQRLGLTNKIDKQVYKAAQFQSATGGNAIDVIKNMPSVSVNGEGEISMRGSNGFQVLINGKPILTDAQTVLSQLPANSIENIELITAPSAKYDPDGKGGIINITTKKGVGEGVSIALNAQGGLPAIHDYNNLEKPVRFGADATINYRKGKLDLTASGNYTRNDVNGFREGNVNTTIRNIFTSLPSTGERSFDKFNYAGRASATFTPNKADVFSIGFLKGKRFQARRADLFYTNSKTDLSNNTVISRFNYFNSNVQTKEGNFFLGNFDYAHTFTNNSILTTSFLYEDADLYGNTKNLNQSAPKSKDTIQYTYNPYSNPIQGYRANIDYAINIGKGKLESGYQFRTDKQEGDFTYLTKNQLTGEYIIDPQFSSGVHSENTIHAVYSQYSGKTKKLSYIGGLRYEYAHRNLIFKKDPGEHELNLSNLFPSANVLYSLNNKTKLKAGFSRRVQRTKNTELNPYPEREHSETLEQGDPNLLPEFINLLELGLTKDFKQGSVFATAYYQQVTNPIQRVNKVFNDSILNRVFTNAGKANLWGLEAGTNIKPTKWWQLYVGANIYNYHIDGKIFNNTIAINNSDWVYSINTNTSFQLAKTWSYQFNLNYISNRPTAQGEDSRFLSPNSSLKKTFMKGMMSAMLQWQNMDAGLLKTNEQRITTRGTNFYTTTNYIYETDVIVLNLSFNLNQLTKKLKLPSSEFGDKEF